MRPFVSKRALFTVVALSGLAATAGAQIYLGNPRRGDRAREERAQEQRARFRF